MTQYIKLRQSFVYFSGKSYIYLLLLYSLFCPKNVILLKISWKQNHDGGLSTVFPFWVVLVYLIILCLFLYSVRYASTGIWHYFFCIESLVFLLKLGNPVYRYKNFCNILELFELNLANEDTIAFLQLNVIYSCVQTLHEKVYVYNIHVNY